MNEVLLRLMDLQKLDSQLLHLESLRGDLPNQVSRLAKEFEEVKDKIEEDSKKLVIYQKEKNVIELEIKALEGKQKKYQAQLFEVKNNREYDAVTHEIESVKMETSKKETRLLELMDLENEIKDAGEESAKEVGILTKQLGEKKTELKKRLAKTEKDEAYLSDQKNKLMKKIEPRMIAAYERIRKAKKDIAVVPVIRHACGGCFKNLPPQKILEIREMNRLYLCETCGRILVWNEKESGLME